MLIKRYGQALEELLSEGSALGVSRHTVMR
jgi:hypothetical protein